MRLVYLSMYFAQVLVAALIGALVAALAPGEPRPNAFLGWVLVALALLQLPLGLAAASRLGRVTSRQAALSRTLLTAVTLSSGAWFAALAVGTGQRGASVLLLLGLLVAAYALGFFTTGRLAGAAAALPPEGEAPADAPPAPEAD